MIYSLTPFFNELDVLEVRLAELDGVVDRHVIAESTLDYAGRRKRLYFEENTDRFSDWLDKIEYVVVDDSPEGETVRAEPAEFAVAADTARWAREKHQREALLRGLPELNAHDTILLSDVDEIPRADVFEQCARHAHRGGMIVRPRLAMHVGLVAWRWPAAVPVIARFFSPATLAEYGSLEAVREDIAFPVGPTHGEAMGWHLSYMGGVAAIQHKLASAAHDELDVPPWNTAGHIARCLQTGADLFGRDYRQAELAPEDEWPPYLLAHRDEFKELIG